MKWIIFPLVWLWWIVRHLWYVTKWLFRVLLWIFIWPLGLWRSLNHRHKKDTKKLMKAIKAGQA